MTFKENLIEIFTFHRGERKGIFILVVLLCGVIAFRWLSPKWFPPDDKKLLAYSENIATWIETTKQDSASEKNYYASAGTYRQEKTLFTFDPNSISDDEWQKLGLNKGQVKSIRNYLEKGGHFFVRSDLSKMFVISEEQYEELYPYIDLPESSSRNFQKEKYAEEQWEAQPSYPKKSFKDHSIRIDINSADTSDFKKLKGIGSYLARKIVEYREKLGGFTSINQLSEVYRMDLEKLDTLRPQLLIDTNLVRKININEAGIDVLAMHPYLNKSQAKALIAYRDQHGKFKTTSEIKRSVLIDEKTYQKIVSYLRVE